MCISSNSVNQAQDLMSVTKFENFPNSLIPSGHMMVVTVCELSDHVDHVDHNDQHV